ncbi:MAG: hypothetical protein ABSD44_07285 [Terracidiphilus sp.]
MREKAQRSQASFEKHDSGGRLTWLGAILCTFFPHRRFSLYDSGAENPSPTPHRQAEIDLGRAAASRETAIRRSRHLPEEYGFSELANSPALRMNQSQSDISWRMPWLYVAFLLLAWLLLL